MYLLKAAVGKKYHKLELIKQEQFLILKHVSFKLLEVTFCTFFFLNKAYIFPLPSFPKNINVPVIVLFSFHNLTLTYILFKHRLTEINQYSILAAELKYYTSGRIMRFGWNCFFFLKTKSDLLITWEERRRLDQAEIKPGGG